MRKVRKADACKEDLVEPGYGKLLRWLLTQSNIKALNIQGVGAGITQMDYSLLNKHGPKMSAWQSEKKWFCKVPFGYQWIPTKSRHYWYQAFVELFTSIGGRCQGNYSTKWGCDEPTNMKNKARRGQSLGWWMINCVSLAPLCLSNYLAWFIGGHSCITRCHISAVWNYENKHINWDRVHFSDRLCTFELQKYPKSCVKTILNVFSHSLLAAYFNWKMVSPRNVDW